MTPENKKIALTVSANLKRLRVNSKMTLRQLAPKLGVHFAHIHKWEQAQKLPRIDNLIKYCKVFNVELKDLLE